MIASGEVKRKLLTRLHRIEEQACGVQRGVAEDQPQSINACVYSLPTPWLYYAKPSSCIRLWIAARASRNGRSR
jgi:hypothetical protein